mmetsp:Transcript_1579/g.2267  ORF Transcript_1579/g.2267 Transcript_1579/m.2267 type:complete len:372 (-) Transcript_1579:63-1178(-)
MGKIIATVSILVAIITVGIPIFISEVVGGWTKKYTSPVRFRPSQIQDLTGKVAIVTGANTGIGYHTALELARVGARVIVAARSEAKGIAAVEKIRAETENFDVLFMQLDLSNLNSVSQFAKAYLKLNLPLHILVLNAGVMKSPGAQYVGQELNYGYEITDDGFEYHIGVNHIAHASLTNHLLDVLKKSSPSRIISVSSAAEEGAPDMGMNFKEWWVPKDGKIPDDYEDGAAYGQSKLANLMYAEQLSKKLDGTGVSVYSCHPGIILTELGRYMAPVLEEGAQSQGAIYSFFFYIFGGIFQMSNFDSAGGALTQLHLATANESELVNGGFYHPIGRQVNPKHPQGMNETLAGLLFEETQIAIKKKSKYTFSE